MKALALMTLTAVLLAGCGNRGSLQPRAGQTMPVKPANAAQTPTVNDLLKPEVQARPQRTDEQLDRSKERRDDKFELPPSG